jgi:hypothetical protein
MQQAQYEVVTTSCEISCTVVIKLDSEVKLACMRCTTDELFSPESSCSSDSAYNELRTQLLRAS